MNKKYFQEIENLIRKDFGCRGIGKIGIIGELEKSARELFTSSTVLIVTGFCIKEKLIGETDGPIGAVSLASGLEQLGKKVILVTDKYSKDILSACCSVKKIKAPIEIVPYEGADKFCNSLLLNYQPSHVVAIERPGRAKDGSSYSMRGEDLSDIIPNTDVLFEKSKELGITTIAVGDGGNEVGMGKVAQLIVDSVYKGDRICAVTSADYLILAGVSNWGGHGLTAALSLLSKTMLLHNSQTETAMLQAMIDVGAVDGRNKKRELTIDGLSLKVNLEILEKLRAIVKSGINDKIRSFPSQNSLRDLFVLTK